MTSQPHIGEQSDTRDWGAEMARTRAGAERRIMKIHSKSEDVRRHLRFLSRGSLVVAALIGSLVLVAASGQRAYAYLSTVGGVCGFHVGSPLVTGAAGSLVLEFPIYPGDPQQVCDVTVTAQVSLRPASGGSYTDVDDNPSSKTLALDFAGGPLPLGIL